MQHRQYDKYRYAQRQIIHYRKYTMSGKSREKITRVLLKNQRICDTKRDHDHDHNRPRIVSTIWRRRDS